MAGGYVAPSGDQLQVLADALQALADRLSELELPTGTSLNSLVDQVQQALADIESTVAEAIAENSYTKSEIDAKDAAITGNTYTKAETDSKVASPGAISPTSVSASGHVSAGGVSTPGTVSAGSVSSSGGSFSGSLSTGGPFHCLDAYNFDITYTRRTAWWGNDGRAGFASSSRTKKTCIEPAVFDIPALLSVGEYSFFYRAEIARRTQLRIDGIDPDYRPKRELGLMAEDLAAAGYGAFVYFDESGNPEGIEYSMLVVPLLAATRHLYAENTAMRTDITALQSAVAELRAAVAAR